MTSFTTIIYCLLTLGLGVFVGAAWGLSRHVELLDWLEARTIRRWMAAMQSLGYEQWRIDPVLEQMGQRIMVNIPPPPAPPAKKSLDVQLSEKHIGVCYREELRDDGDLIMQICLDHADELQKAAAESDGFLFAVLEDRMRDELIKKSETALDLHPVVKISRNPRDDYDYIQVEFNLERHEINNNYSYD